MTNHEISKSEKEATLRTYIELGTYPNDGDRVSVVGLEDTTGMTVDPRHLTVRAEGVTGTVVGYVPGHGGDVWFISHDDQDLSDEEVVGAYSIAEIASTSQV